MMAAAGPARSETPLWRPMVMALSQTGAASIASGLMSAVGTKIVAALLGPGSFALLQTLQQLRDGAAVVATVNGRMALVQGATELEGAARREYLRTAALLFALGTGLVAVALVALPGEFVRYSRLPQGSQALLGWVAATVALISVFSYLTAMVNAMGDIGRLALLQLTAPLAAAAVAWPAASAIRAGRPLAMGWLLAVPAAASVIGGAWALCGRGAAVRAWFKGFGRYWTNEAARHFFSISGAMLVSGLAETAALFVVRTSITGQEGLATTGQFDAAWNISMNHVTLILASIQAYYLPLLSAARDPRERARQIRGMMIVASVAIAPMIVTLAALKPAIVAILYSKAFAASPRFLRWTLLGDYLKVGCWVLMTPMLAARELGVFLSVDLLVHAIFWGSAKLFSRILAPSEGAALGFLVSYSMGLCVCYSYARLRHGFRLGAAGRVAWAGGFALVVAASAAHWSQASVDVRAAGCWIAMSVVLAAGYGSYLRRREP